MYICKLSYSEPNNIAGLVNTSCDGRLPWNTNDVARVIV